MNGAEASMLGSLLVLSVIDLREKQISLVPVLVLGTLAVVYRLCSGISWMEVALGIIPGLILIVFAFCTRESIGYGDGAVLCALGLFCGVKQSVAVLGMALVLSSILAIVLLVFKKVGRKTELPFLPCLCSGYLLCLLW